MKTCDRGYTNNGATDLMILIWISSQPGLLLLRLKMMLLISLGVVLSIDIELENDSLIKEVGSIFRLGIFDANVWPILAKNLLKLDAIFVWSEVMAPFMKN